MAQSHKEGAVGTCGRRRLGPCRPSARRTRAPASLTTGNSGCRAPPRAAVESTGATGFGAFAGVHPLDETRLLAASTDSVGTKLILARARSALRSCGADLAAHCINDVLTCGADPLLLLDHVAANRIDLESESPRSPSRARPRVCRNAGRTRRRETAELPGIYKDDELDFAGTCVGIVEREQLIDGSRIEVGDAIVSMPSAEVRWQVHARAPNPRARGLRRRGHSRRPSLPR